jgi:hypothetical protein
MCNIYYLSSVTVVTRTLPVLSKIGVNSGSIFWPIHLQPVGLPVPNENLRDFTVFYADINVAPSVRWMPFTR